MIDNQRLPGSSTRRTEWLLTLLRLLLIVVAVIIYLTGSLPVVYNSNAALFLVSCALIYVLGLAVILPRIYYRHWLAQWSLALTIIDAFLVSLAVWLTGGAGSPLALFYIPFVLGAMLRFSRYESRSVAMIMGLSYLLVVLVDPRFDVAGNSNWLASVVTNLMLIGIISIIGEVIISEITQERQQHLATQQRFADAVTMQQSTQRLHSSLNIRTVAENIVAQIRMVVPDVWCAVVLENNNHHMYGIEPAQAEVLHAWTTNERTEELLNTRSMIELDSLSEQHIHLPQPETQHLVAMTGIRTMIILPLCSPKACDGILFVGLQTRTFAPAERVIIETLSIGAGAALANAIRYQNERDTATTLRHIAKLKNDFICMVGHELRTPLTSAKGFAQLMMRQKNPTAEQVHNAAAVIVAQCERLAERVEFIIDISKLESSLLELRKQPLQLTSLVQKTAGKLLEERGYTYTINAPHYLPAVRGDSSGTEMALYHLLNLSTRHESPASPIVINLRAEPDGVIVEIQDRNAALTSDEMTYLFSSLCGVDTPPEYQRKVMGLYEARNCIEAQGGTLWAESKPDLGAIFYFKLGF